MLLKSRFQNFAADASTKIRMFTTRYTQHSPEGTSKMILPPHGSLSHLLCHIYDVLLCHLYDMWRSGRVALCTRIYDAWLLRHIYNTCDYSATFTIRDVALRYIKINPNLLVFMTVSTENDAPPKSTKSRNSHFSVSRGTNTK